MGEFSIVICDADSAYAHALSRFLCGLVKQISVSVFTQTEAFSGSRSHYQMGLLGKEFLQIYENRNTDVSIDDVFYLSSKACEEYGSYQVFYKFQNMSGLREIINHKRHEENMGCNQSDKPKIFGIYSPIYHDLRVPFGLTFSHLLSQKRETLFLDTEQFSVLPNLIPANEFNTDFMDLIYLLKSQKDDFDLKQHVFYFEDIALLPVTQNPVDFAAVEEEIWRLLFKKIMEAGYQLVVLLDRVDCKMEILLPYMDELILLGRPEDYFDFCQENCRKYFDGMEEKTKIHSVKLAMSATGLRDGCYEMKRIMEGNLAGVVKNEFERTFAAAGIK